MSKPPKQDDTTDFLVELDDVTPEDEISDFDDPEQKRKTKLENDQTEQDIDERKRYSKATFFITSGWVIFIAIATLLQMIFSWWGRGISDASYIALMTTSTATVLGMWGFVGAYLFRR